MAQWAKALAAKYDGPWNYTVEGKSQLLQAVLISTHFL